MADDNDIKINPNTTDEETLAALPGVGPVLAGRIRAARPFEDLEGMGKVSGVGPRLLARIAPRVTFEAAEAEEPPPKAEDREGEVIGVAPSRQLVPVAAKEETQPGVFTRAEATTLVLGASLVSFVLAVIVTLVVLFGINRTLDFGQHRTVNRLAGDLANLESGMQDLSARLSTMDRRLGEMDSLGGRLATLERELGGLQGEFDSAVAEVDSMRGVIADVQQGMDGLDGRVTRLDAFLEGLWSLLGGLMPPAEAEPGGAQ